MWSRWTRTNVRSGVLLRYYSTKKSPKSKYDVSIIGGGHNGLITASYLAKKGFSVGVFERRHVVGGAAVTEEIIPGYKFSRASYVLSLLRPQIIKDLELMKHGLKVYIRTTGSFTPILEDGVVGKPPRSLRLLLDQKETFDEISKFSKKDAEAFSKYESFVSKVSRDIAPLLDNEPPNLWDKTRNLGSDLPAFYELATAPITKILNRWFESEPLIATLATDGVIGAMLSPRTPGSGYVLLHHMLGEVNGSQGAWGFVRGGMGALSEIIANVARTHGADIFTSTSVREITVSSDGTKSTGVLLEDGTHIESKIVVSNATLQHTVCNLLEDNARLPDEFKNAVNAIDYTSPVTKINVAVDRAPNFLSIPNKKEGITMDHHKGTIHLNCENEQFIHDAYLDAENGIPSKKPMIEMCIPSSHDDSLAPSGHHVISMFTQYTPYKLKGGKNWTYEDRENYSSCIFNTVEGYAPGFKRSIVGYEMLTPNDLEREFGLTGGNIFHGAMSFDQLFLARPTTNMPGNKAPMEGLYFCGSGTHPGGGVMGSCGRLAALRIIREHKR